MAERPSSHRFRRLIFLPVLGSLLGIWAVFAFLTASERRFAIERAEAQLAATVVTLADFNELAGRVGGGTTGGDERRSAALWRALLQYPTASIWFESDGVLTSGQPPGDASIPSILVEEDRGEFSVYAALPLADALESWQRAVWRRAGTLLAATIAFLLLTQFLIRALEQRTKAEQGAAAARERTAQLARYQTQLEQTVEQRTEELRTSNERLETELTERRAAEAELKEHDALLHSVTKSAAQLLGSHNHEDATAAVLELIGKTVGVGRVHINEIETSRDGHMRSTIRYEWCAPGMTPLIDNAAMRDLDLTTELPRVTSPLLTGGLATFSLQDLTGELKQPFADYDLRSFLQIPIEVDGELWGSLNFIDASDARREWTWAETDTLQTLAGLIGAAITRARYVKDLADANMIVQNSPTILYRVRGEPPFSLVYVSHNITKFGHDADDLVGTENWAERLMDPDDLTRMREAMARALESHAKGSSIEFRLRTGDGSYRWVENRYTTVRDKNDRLVEIEGMIIDVTERKLAEEKIAHLARTDALTGLANRATFIERLRHAFAATQRGATPFAIHYLDLDHFKAINDTLGHPVGDLLLREVADRLRACTRESDVVARLGGDEFAILQNGVTEPANAGALAGMLQGALTKPYSINGNDLHVTVSIGICPYAADSTGPDEMLSQADLALYRSKDEGRNRYRFHSDDLDDQVLERVTMADDLRTAIEEGQLELRYQPQVELQTGRVAGMEAFVRWHHPTRGLLPASAFIPVAEKTGTIIALGQWVLEQACRQMKQWRDEGMRVPVITMNLSMAQLKNRRELLEDVKRAIEKWGVAPADLCFDVTEATLAQLTLMRNDVLTELRELGIGIAIDDFGAEYSSFNYLRTYRVSHLKMAQSFIDDAVNDHDRAATVRAILNLAKELGIGVVTEGVETEEQRDLSSETSIIAQGYFFSDALNAAEAHDLLAGDGILDPHGDPDSHRALLAALRAAGREAGREAADDTDDTDDERETRKPAGRERRDEHEGGDGGRGQREQGKANRGGRAAGGRPSGRRAATRREGRK